MVPLQASYRIKTANNLERSKRKRYREEIRNAPDKEQNLKTQFYAF